MTTKEEALKLADELDALHQYVPSEAPAMIRRLVAENSFLKDWRDTWTPYVNRLKQTKPLSDDEVMNTFESCLFDGGFNAIEFARAIEERHGIK